MEFRTIVSIVAIVILIIVLVIIGFSLSRIKDPKWPPVTPECPDYWELDGTGKCKNTKALGTCNTQSGANTVDFSEPEYAGSLGPCRKYNWAKSCGVTWDGVTYGVPNPCDITLQKKP